MKVHELITKLMSVQAGADILVSLQGTLNANIEDVIIESDGTYGQVILAGGDAQLLSDEGDEIGYLSEISSRGGN